MAAETGACNRAREWASRRLDGELSEFEGVLLEAHLDRCEACCLFDVGIKASTDALREAPLLPIQWSVKVPRLHTRPPRSYAALPVAAVSALILAFSIVTATSPGKPSSRVHPLEL